MLAPLATPDDLAARNITLPAGVDPDAVLASASASVRDAAGCPISQATSTVPLVCSDWEGLDLPGVPVSTVASVVVEGETVAQSVLANRVYSAGWRLVGDRLLFRSVYFTPPAIITVTYTHGLAVVPADIVDLVCGIANIAGRASVDGAYGAAGRSKSIRLGDYAESFDVPAGADSPSPVAVPDAVRDRLRARFGTSVAVLRVSR